MSDRLKIELWESPGEYVVTLDGKPIGQTVNQREGNQLIGWLNTTGMVAEIDRLRANQIPGRCGECEYWTDLNHGFGKCEHDSADNAKNWPPTGFCHEFRLKE